MFRAALLLSLAAAADADSQASRRALREDADSSALLMRLSCQII
jgi:hypothetical protein